MSSQTGNEEGRDEAAGTRHEKPSQDSVRINGWTLYNQTARRLKIRLDRANEEVVVPPLGEQTITFEEDGTPDDKSLRKFGYSRKIFTKLTERGILKVTPIYILPKFAWSLLFYGLLGAVLLFGLPAYLIGLLIPTIQTLCLGLALPLILLVGIGGTLSVSQSTDRPTISGEKPDGSHDSLPEKQDASPLRITARFLGPVMQITGQSVSLVLTLAISILMPAIAIFYFGGIKSYVGNDGTPPDLVLLGRIMQFTFIALAGALPGLLFFLFDRQRLGVIRSRVERDIFRLQRSFRLLGDVRTKYGGIIEEVYGTEKNTQRLLSGSRWPIFIATMTLSLGLMLTLLPFGTPTISQPIDLYLLFIPKPTTVAWGFTGAYIFALTMVLRGYARGDLRPKTYSNITVRIVTALFFAGVIHILTTPSDIPQVNTPEIGNLLRNTSILALGTALLVGYLPDTFWTFVRQSFSRVSGGEFVRRTTQSLETNSASASLTELQGTDLYDLTRLEEEGITSLQSLVHYDIVSLMLYTRIPSERLIDWVDQAILQLHMLPPEEETSREVKKYLRKYGVRNASDFNVWLGKEAEFLTGKDKSAADKDTGANRPPLDFKGQNQEDLSSILYSLWQMIQDDEWFVQVLHWRKDVEIKDLIIDVDEQGGITVHWDDESDSQHSSEPEVSS